MAKYDNVGSRPEEVLTDWQLCRLRDCCISARHGMADQGFPTVMKELEALGFVKAAGTVPGFKPTDKGFKYVQERAAKLRVI